MNTVFLKTRELGQALLESPEYQAMKAAEDKAMANQQAAQTMGEYLEKKGQVEQLLAGERPDPAALKALSDQMDQLQEQLHAIEDIAALTQARQAFSDLIDQVNQVLRFIVTGQLQPDQESCSGSCSSCGGCH